MTYTPEETRARLRTQDNRITSHPMFLVQEQVRDYGIDTDYDPAIAWLYADESVEVDPDEATRLEAAYQDTMDEPEGFRRVGYGERWEYVTCCFTYAAASEYVAHNGHRHKGQLRVYVDSGHRNLEWQAVRAMLMGEPS